MYILYIYIFFKCLYKFNEFFFINLIENIYIYIFYLISISINIIFYEFKISLLNIEF